MTHSYDPALGRLRQEGCKLETSPGYTAILVFRRLKQENQKFSAVSGYIESKASLSYMKCNLKREQKNKYFKFF